VLELEEDTGVLLELTSLAEVEVVVLVVGVVEMIVVVVVLVISEEPLVSEDDVTSSELELVSVEVVVVDDRPMDESSKIVWHENKTKVSNRVGIKNAFFTRFPQNYFIMLIDET
jgi:hypothetical protein